MTERAEGSNAGLIKYQRIMLYISVLFLAVACLLLIFKAPLGKELSRWGVIFVLVATLGQLLVMAQDFKQSGNRRFMFLSYVLVATILICSILGAWII